MNNQMKENDLNWIDVCSLQSLTPYDGVCALVDGQQVALFRVADNDQVYATSNYDPIGKASVMSRGIVGDLAGRKVIASPLYKQHFDLETGECLEQPDEQIAVYATRIIDGVIQIACPDIK